MLAQEIRKLENENLALREELKLLSVKMEQNEVVKPKSCQYCRHYVQYYIKGGAMYQSEYTPIYDGHCACGVPIKKGRKRKPAPDDTCMYFEIGAHEAKCP